MTDDFDAAFQRGFNAGEHHREYASTYARILDNPLVEYVTLEHEIPETFYTLNKERDKPRLVEAIFALLQKGVTQIETTTFMHPHQVKHVTLHSVRTGETFLDVLDDFAQKKNDALGASQSEPPKTVVIDSWSALVAESTSKPVEDESVDTLKVVDFGGSVLIASNGSKELFGRIVEALIFKRRSVILDFEGVERITAGYLNEAVGQLYRIMSKDFIKRYMEPPVNINPMHLTLLKTVIDNAKHTWRRREKLEKQSKTEIGLPKTAEEYDTLRGNMESAQMRARNQPF